MKKLLLSLVFISLASPVFAQVNKINPNALQVTPTGSGTTDSLADWLALIDPGPLPVVNGGTGADTLGPTITNANETLNTSTPIRFVSGTTDTIDCTTDAGRLIIYSNASPIAVTVPAASTAGCTSGFGFTAQVIGAGTATFTPTSGLINGAASVAVATNKGCSFVSDSSDYYPASCTAIP